MNNSESIISSLGSHIVDIGRLNDDFADLMDLFEMQKKYKLLFSTKKDKIPEKIEEKVYSKVYNQTIFCFIINSQAIADNNKQLGPFDIISCAYRLKKQGQHIRILIDYIYITKIECYQKEYMSLIDVLNDFLKPEQIFIGSVHGEIGLSSENIAAVYLWFKQNLKCNDVVCYN